MSAVIRILTTRNVGALDRIMRALPGVVVAVLWWRGDIAGTSAVVLAVLSGAALLTSVLGSCSIYYALGWSTCPISGKPKA